MNKIENSLPFQVIIRTELNIKSLVFNRTKNSRKCTLKCFNHTKLPLSCHDFKGSPPSSGFQGLSFALNSTGYQTVANGVGCMMVILKRSRLSLASSHLRRLITTNPRRIVDEGDWFYASEWWGNGDSDENTVFRSVSDKGNGVVSVVASHSSRPVYSHSLFIQ